MSKLLDWIEHRTGLRSLVRAALYEHIPGGARWRYVWGSALTFALFVQFVTGAALWMAYSANANDAWSSVYYIQYEMWGGWLLRGIHHYTAQVMTILLALHLMQVVIDGAYKAPREVNFWFGLLLLFLVLALSLTGYLLPWDQKGYWATKVATSIAAITPGIGPELQKIILGGVDYGHHTLTRFFALHAGIIPGAIVLLVVGHIYLFRRHGITAKKPYRKPDAMFWPDQVFCDVVACLAVLATVLFLVLRTHGADLGAPADPAEPYAAARPDWYFMFLFQFLKYFPQGTEVWGAIVIPGLLVTAICLMPFLGKWKLGHRANVGMVFVFLAGFGLLTWLAYADDRNNPAYHVAVEEAERRAERIKELARSPSGIPPTGAISLLRQDPLTQGPVLFARHCASCHRYDGHDGTGHPVGDPQSASDLQGFASREWLAGVLDPERIVTTNYFGATKFAKGKMIRFVTRDVADFSAEEREQLRKAIAALSAEAGLKAQREMEMRDAALIEEGKKLIDSAEMRCTECHTYYFEDEDTTAPTLTGYGSREWLMGLIANPAHARFYGDKNDRMPAFGSERILSPEEIELIADWLRGDWYEAGEVASADGIQPQP